MVVFFVALIRKQILRHLKQKADYYYFLEKNQIKVMLNPIKLSLPLIHHDDFGCLVATENGLWKNVKAM